MANARKTRLGCERLDERTMPSITLSGGVLAVVGTGGNDLIRVTNAAGGKIQATVSTTGESQLFNLAAVSSIDIRCGGGNDQAVVGPNMTIAAIVRGAAGNDSLFGGGGGDSLLGGAGDDMCVGRMGDDTIHGHDGRDFCSGGSGNDHLFGDGGDDDCRGGSGDDSLDGGPGRDGCQGGDGNDNISHGFDLDTELIAVFTGGQGDAEFKFGPEDGGIEREFEVEIEDLAPATAYGVFVGATQVGTIVTNAIGDGRLEFETNFDADHDGAVEFPAGFPEISVGSVVTVRHANGTVVRQGSFIVNPNP